MRRCFQTTRLLGHASYWLLEQHREDLDIDLAVRRFKTGTAALQTGSAGVVDVTEQARIAGERAGLIAQRVPDQLATAIASLDTLHCALDLVEVATRRETAHPGGGPRLLRHRRAARPRLDQAPDRVAGDRRALAVGRAAYAAATTCSPCIAGSPRAALAAGRRRRHGAGGRLAGGTCRRRWTICGGWWWTCAPAPRPTLRRCRWRWIRPGASPEADRTMRRGPAPAAGGCDI